MEEPTTSSAAQMMQTNDSFAAKWVQFLSPPEWRGRVEVEFREVPLCQLQSAGCCLDRDVVNGWVERLRAGAPVPPPVAVATERGMLYLHDGNHRYQAMMQYFGSTETLVRVAVVVPHPGFSFRSRQLDGYMTYVLTADARSWRTFAVWALIPLLCATALLLTHGVPGTANSPFFVFLVLSVLAAARAAGWAGGLVASALNSAAAAFLLLPPFGSPLIANHEHAAQLLLTAVTMVAASIYVGVSGRSASFSRLRHRS